MKKFLSYKKSSHSQGSCFPFSLFLFPYHHPACWEKYELISLSMINYMKMAGIIILAANAMACGSTTGPVPVGSDTVKTAEIKTVHAEPDTFATGKLISPVICRSDPSQSYALYIPAHNDHDSLPVIYFFDPHGDGSLPLTKYKSLSDQYHYILIGSNNSKNGNDFSTAGNIWNTLFFDSKKRLPINVNRVYTCGFSGGAKVAGYIAINHPEIKGVIAGGAALPDDTAPADFHFTFTAIAGEGDMNMTDLVAVNQALDKTKTVHRIIFFDGKHEWCPENSMRSAFTGLQLDAMRGNLIPKDVAFIDNYISSGKKNIDTYLHAGNYIRAEAECLLSIHLLDGLTDRVADFTNKDRSLKDNPAYQHQIRERQEILATEQNRKALFSQQFSEGDMNYWKNTIRDLQSNSTVKTATGAMNQRLLAYLSLAFYSISNQLINSHRDADAAHFVELYKLDDPSNPEAWYFSAILHARSNKANAAKEDLLTAVQNGFADKSRLESQTEFQTIQLGVSEIESRMK
jgi:hypothetical protein